MVEFFYSLTFTVFFLIIWFKTDVFYQYCELFDMHWFLFGYTENSTLTFPQYLYTKRHLITKSKYLLFYFKLISCPLCLGFWLSMLFTTVFSSLLLLPAVYLFSILTFLIFSKFLDY